MQCWKGDWMKVVYTFCLPYSLKIRQRPTINPTGEKISPCNTPRHMSKISEYLHIPSTSAPQRQMTLCMEFSRVVYKGYNCFPVQAHIHLVWGKPKLWLVLRVLENIRHKRTIFCRKKGSRSIQSRRKNVYNFLCEQFEECNSVNMFFSA